MKVAWQVSRNTRCELVDDASVIGNEGDLRLLELFVRLINRSYDQHHKPYPSIRPFKKTSNNEWKKNKVVVSFSLESNPGRNA